MCLNRVNVYEQPIHGEIVAYKVFDLTGEGLCFEYRSLTGLRNDDFLVPMGLWLRSTDIVLETNPAYDKYPSGFHCYKNRADAARLMESSCSRVVEVKIRTIVAEGSQWQPPAPVWVAKEMFVPEGVY